MRPERMKRARRALLLALAFIAPLAPHLAPGLKSFGRAAAAETAQVAYDKGLLWRVEKSGVAPSYLFGTIHIADPRVTALPDVVRNQLDAAKSFTMEVALDSPNIATLAARMVYTDGRDLPGVVGEELFGKLASLMAQQGMPAEIVRMFKPWAVALMLSMPQQESENVLDFMLYRAASARGKPVLYLETADDQVSAFEGMSEADQIALLRHTVETHAELAATTEKMVQAYLQRDLGAMWRIDQEDVKDRPDLKQVNDVFVQRLLFERNTRMAERMQPQLREGNAFVAVGALHLYGERGLLNLLARDGYRVSRVY